MTVQSGENSTLLTASPDMAQAQCQKDLKGLNKQIETKQGDLEAAQQELQQQQKAEAGVQKRISEAERRLQVRKAFCSFCNSSGCMIILPWVCPCTRIVGLTHANTEPRCCGVSTW